MEAGSAFGRGLDDYPITYLKVGYAPYVFYLPHFAGLDAHGHTLLLGTDGTPVSANSRDVAKFYIDPSPDFSYGFGSTLSYGNLSLEFFLRGVAGQKLFNNTLLNIESLSRLPGNNVTVETLTSGIKDKKVIISDKSLEDASYMRLDNISLSYSFPHIKKLQSLRVYITANNLFLITKYRGLDPEMQTADDDAISYIDATFGGNGFYPKTRSFSLGVNVSF